LRSADSEASERAKEEGASDVIQKAEPKSKCNRKEFLSSKPSKELRELVDSLNLNA
jgi:hypothetical protein